MALGRVVGVPLPGQRGGDRGSKDAVLGLGKFPKQLLPPLVAESIEAVAGENGFQGPPLAEEVDDLLWSYGLLGGLNTQPSQPAPSTSRSPEPLSMQAGTLRGGVPTCTNDQ